MIGLWMWAATAWAATPFAGVEARPLSRADLVWVSEERTTGLGVGEFDGVVKPSWGAFGGVWFNRYVGVSATLGVAWRTAATSVDEAVQRQQWAVVRPGLDLRLGWMEPQLYRPIPWFFVGVHGDVPVVRDVDASRTEAQQEEADQTAAVERYRLGGVGGRFGAAVDYQVLPGLSLGASYGVGLHRSLYLGGDTGLASWWVQNELSLLLTFSWGDRHAKRQTGR